MNKALAFISILLISLFVISAASAADNISEVAVISDADDSADVISVENDEEISIDADNSVDIISADNDDVISTDAVEKETIIAEDESASDVSTIDLSGLFNGTGINFGGESGSTIDLSGLLNGTGISLGGETGSTIDLSGFLNGTGISFGNGTFDISGLLNGTGISFGNGTFDISGLLNGTFDISSLLNGTGISFTNGTLSFGNTTFDLSSLLNGTFDISSLLNGTGINLGNLTGNSTFDISSILDLFGGNTKKVSINSSDRTKYYTKTTAFKVTVKNGNETLSQGSVVFTIDNKEYVGHIGSDGVATAKIKTLKPGKHYIISEYGDTIVKNVITVKKAIITKNVSVKSKKGGKFTVKVLNSKGKAHSKQTVKIKFKGKTYTLKTNKKGIATFKIPKKLKVGKYTIKTTCKGLTLSNKITVKK